MEERKKERTSVKRWKIHSSVWGSNYRIQKNEFPMEVRNKSRFTNLKSLMREALWIFAVLLLCLLHLTWHFLSYSVSFFFFFNLLSYKLALPHFIWIAIWRGNFDNFYVYVAEIFTFSSIYVNICLFIYMNILCKLFLLFLPFWIWFTIFVFLFFFIFSAFLFIFAFLHSALLFKSAMFSANLHYHGRHFEIYGVVFIPF